MASSVATAYGGGGRAMPPVGSMGKIVGHGVRGEACT